ncbi:ABC transporter permease [Tabrizicola sp.]|jgi:peptide/nickel transport system permease protein|uniref:ABC transporter permease n=1 Tax=Tabrizicola sp. TaxID=2005166 RepID=UPI0025F652A8|nr:ABC transporter permease [Tabrizicola sp.]MBY0352265.1 ABC transporter permease [Tabrizicola sp.]MDK2773991.1 ABC transporter permease [Tabrizicola sp.]
MLTFTLRRLLLAVPTLLVISLVIFLVVDLAPGSPMSEIPLTIPPEVRRKMIAALGADQPVFVRYLLWLRQFFWVEPASLFDGWFGTALADGEQRILSWQSRSPVFSIIGQRLPQTLTVIGTAYIVGILIALPIGIYSAYRQYSWFDQAGTLFAMIGFSVPTFFSGTLFILLFAVWLGWFPTKYDTQLEVRDWASFWQQARQMAMPVMTLGLANAAAISRYMRSSMLDNMGMDYVRTARAKGMSERTVVLKHVLRNSLIPVVTVIALGIPSIFGGAIVTENLFGVNGIGAALIGAIQANDIPMVQTLAFIFAVLIVLFNLIADILYGLLDPRIRYE